MTNSRGKKLKPLNTFLSCSIRPRDRPLVDAIQSRVLEPMGFRCVTVGRNVSLPAQPDDAIRAVIDACHCLVGVATARFDAKDVDYPDRTLGLATPYLLQETSMAHQARLPFLIFKTPEVSLQGLTGRNLYVGINRDLSASGRPVFKASRDLVVSSLDELKRRAEARREQRTAAMRSSTLGDLAKAAVVGYGLFKGLEALGTPDCIGTFDDDEETCGDCGYRAKCIDRLLKNAGELGADEHDDQEADSDALW